MPAKKKKCRGKQPCLRMTQVTKDKIAAGMRAYHARCRACNAHKKVDAAIASKRVATPMSERTSAKSRSCCARPGSPSGSGSAKASLFTPSDVMMCFGVISVRPFSTTCS